MTLAHRRRPSGGIAIERGPSDNRNEVSRAFVLRTLVVLGLAALVVVAALLLWSAVEIFLLAFAGVLLAVLLHTAAEFLAERTGMPHGLALAGVILALVLAAVGGGWAIGPRIGDQASRLVEELPQSIGQLQEAIRGLPGGEWLLDNLGGGDGSDGSGIGVVSRVTGTASAVWDVLVKMIYVLFLGLFLAADPAMYREGAVRLFPQAARAEARDTLNLLGRTLRGWLLGQIVAMVMVGTLSAVGLWIIGIPMALALGIIAGLLEFVPIVGPVIGFIPAALLAFGEGATSLLWVVLLYIVIQQLEGNVIMPLVQRRAVDLPPALTISAVVVAGAALGMVGLLVATPLMAVVLVLVKKLYLGEALGEAHGEDRADDIPSG